MKRYVPYFVFVAIMVGILIAGLACENRIAEATPTAVNTPVFPPTWTPSQVLPTATNTAVPTSTTVPSATSVPAVIIKAGEEVVFENPETGKHYAIRILEIEKLQNPPPEARQNGYYRIIAYFAHDGFSWGFSEEVKERACWVLDVPIFTSDLCMVDDWNSQVISFRFRGWLSGPDEMSFYYDSPWQPIR